MINETFAKALGLTALNAPGRRLYPQHDANEPVNFVEIIGVIKDYNNNSLHEEVQPLMLRYGPVDATNNIIVAADTKDYQRLLKNISHVWQRNFPQTPFAYSFLDEDVQQQYQAEVTLSNIINAFTLIAIFICCLGLFGLSAFMAEQRKKEIGIRKVLGANLLILVSLLSKDFVRLAGIALIIAIPFAWWALDKWLQTFAYRITLSWWEFALAGFVVMLIALTTVSIQAIRSAVANPVKSLKIE
ncbi:ABC transporter permease [Chitinophaga pinensis]|uniref:ABC transporter permease n=1 Tax=Chitinophaga pinensis TaxID=79329 RepID=UPI0021BD5089|nr:FtsX-like permease family protein [Chitinophaga pinensis]